MYVVIVNVHVNADDVDAFIVATAANHTASCEEPGNLRYDVLRRTDDPARFVLYEVYDSEAAFTAHQKTAHYLAWKEQVASMMAEPRSAQKCAHLFPEPWE